MSVVVTAYFLKLVHLVSFFFVNTCQLLSLICIDQMCSFVKIVLVKKRDGCYHVIFKYESMKEGNEYFSYSNFTFVCEKVPLQVNPVFQFPVFFLFFPCNFSCLRTFNHNKIYGSRIRKRSLTRGLPLNFAMHKIKCYR